MTGDEAVQLSAYFGESDRADGELLSDALLGVLEGHGIRTAMLLRGIEGFGVKHLLHTQRLLTLSEDLPLVAVALDDAARIDAVLPDTVALVTEGLVTLERARTLDGWGDLRGAGVGDEAKLTVCLGRTERPGYRAVTELLRASGVAGATVLLGLDGMVDGVRRRARFFSTNDDVPLAIVSIGAVESLAGAVAALGGTLASARATIERVQVCKRDGTTISEPRWPPDTDVSGRSLWQKLTVYAAEQAHVGRHPLYVELVRRLRAANAPGATSLRGIWGYSGDHAPHGDTLTSIRRRVPVVTTVIDRPGPMRHWWQIVDELTADAGLVTTEVVPAFRAVGPGIEQGGLELANP